jgi:DNA polymerase III sliding clamp (beta) subunit (PCNA family)
MEQLLIPRTALPSIMRMCSETQSIAVSATASRIQFSTASTTLTVKVTDDRFPPWQAILPDVVNRLNVNAGQLKGALRSVLFALKEKRAVSLSFSDGHLQIETRSDTVDDIKVSIPASGSMKSFGCNVDYLIEAIRRDDITLCTTDSPTAPVMIEGDGLRAIVMPVML